MRGVRRIGQLKKINRCLGFPTRMDDDEVVSSHLPAARLHMNIPAVVGVYFDVLRHLRLNANLLHMTPFHLIQGIPDEFEEDPILVIPYCYGCDRGVGVYINQRSHNLKNFGDF